MPTTKIKTTCINMSKVFPFFLGALTTTDSQVQFQKGYLLYPTFKNCEPNKLLSHYFFQLHREIERLFSLIASAGGLEITHSHPYPKVFHLFFT